SKVSSRTELLSEPQPASDNSSTATICRNLGALMRGDCTHKLYQCVQVVHQGFLQKARVILMSAPAPVPCAELDTLLLQQYSMAHFDRQTNASPRRLGRSSFSRNDDR